MKAAQSGSEHCSEGIRNILVFTTGTQIARPSPQDKSFRDSKVCLGADFSTWWILFLVCYYNIFFFIAHSVSWAWRTHFRKMVIWLYNYKALCCVKSKLINICWGSKGVIWCVYLQAAVGSSWVSCLFKLLRPRIRNNTPDFQTWSITC